MIEVYRRVGEEKVPLFRVDKNKIDNIDRAKVYGLDKMTEDEIKQKLWDNPYLGWREIHE